MAWKKLKPLTDQEAGFRSGCLTCGPQPMTLPKDAILATGFGQVDITKNGKPIWSGDDVNKTLTEFDEQAEKDPDHDWRVAYHGPLSDDVYQRQGGEWVLIERGRGFA